MSETVVITGPILRIRICRLAVAGVCAEAEKATAASKTAERKNGSQRLDRMGYSGCGRLRCGCLRVGLGAEPPQQVIADAEGIGHDRQRRIHGCAGWEKAAIDDIEIVDFVRFTIHVECRSFGGGGAPTRACRAQG